MSRYEMKRQIAAVLCMAMVCASLPFGALAEATPGEAAPEAKQEEKQEEKREEKKEKQEEKLVELIVPMTKPEEKPEEKQPDAAPVVQAPQLLAAPAAQQQEKTFGPIAASISTDAEKFTLTVTITDATEDEDMIVYVDGFADQDATLQKGGSATFAVGKAGEYFVGVEYYNNTEFSFEKTVTLAAAEQTTPPPAEQTTPPAAEQTTPPAAEQTTPPAAEQTTPPPAEQVKPATTPDKTAHDFSITPAVKDGEISVLIRGAGEREIEVVLLDGKGNAVAADAIIGEGTVNLGTMPVGQYTVRAQYVTPTQDANGQFDFKTVTAPVEVKTSREDEIPKINPVDIAAKIDAGKDYAIVTVTDANDAPMLVFFGDGEGKAIAKGGSVRFDGLTPGATYGVEIDYVDLIEGARAWRGSVTIAEQAKLGEIKITAVTPGENKLTVSGTATAGQQLLLTTTPAAAADAYAKANDKGTFSVEISCAAGTYTAVTAKYVADGSISAKASGTWVVSAPAAKPSLAVDDVDALSTTVVAKTTPGLVVELKASDYSQKVTADRSGVVRFSLPHLYGAGEKMTLTVFYGTNQTLTQEITVGRAEYLGTLEYGDTGDEVEKLTARLEALGYPVSETSRYGSKVREAVRLFQRANGLDDDGIAGKKTQKALFSVGAIAYGKDEYPTLVRGDRDLQLIYTLQQRLKDLGYYTIKVDGIYGSGTQRAVREFQRVNGLTVTGKADSATQTLLYSSSAKPADYGVDGDYKTLSRSGKYKSAVVPLQRRLRDLGYYAGNIDGYFGSQTYRAVRNFQRRNDLDATGVADPKTQSVLYSSSAKKASGAAAGSGSASTTGYRLLYWGCKGDAVKRLQNALIDAGYKSIVRSADGIFGQWTYDAVRAYQKANGLSVDGIAGKNTQNKLYGTSY